MKKLTAFLTMLCLIVVAITATPVLAVDTSSANVTYVFTDNFTIGFDGPLAVTTTIDTTSLNAALKTAVDSAATILADNQTDMLNQVFAFLLAVIITGLAFQQRNVFIYLLAVPVDFIYGLSLAAGSTPGSPAWVVGIAVAIIGTFILFRVAVSEFMPLVKKLRNR